MNSFVAQHPLPSLLAAWVLGMLVKWVLDLFLLRSRIFGLENRVTQRDRELADLRHEHGRVLTDLKNRLTELDATQKAKSVLNTTLAARVSEVAEARARCTALDAELGAARAEIARLSAVLAETTDGLHVAERRASSAANELHAWEEELTDARLRLAQAEAAERTARDAAAQWQGGFRLRETELGIAGSRISSLERSLSAGSSVHDALQSAVLARDADLDAAKRAVAESEEKLAAANDALGTARRDADAAGKERAVLEKELAAVSGLAKELASAKSARAAADSLVKQREIALADLERRVAELQSAFDDAAKENEGISRALAATRIELAAARDAVGRFEKSAAQPASTVPDPALVARLASLEAELGRLREGRATLEAELGAVSESHARLERDLAASREECAGLEARLQAQPEELAEVGRDLALTTMLADMDEISRERNELAAELALLRAKGEPGTATKAKAAKSQADAVVEYVAACPQHLGDAKGIGPAFETRLYEAGIGSYWELSRLGDRELAMILELDDAQAAQLDCEGIRADAARLAAETNSVGRKWSQEPPDDLESIAGIGAAFEKKLYDAGICTFEALASAPLERLEEICPGNPSKRPDHAAWIARARQLVEARER